MLLSGIFPVHPYHEITILHVKLWSLIAFSIEKFGKEPLLHFVDYLKIKPFGRALWKILFPLIFNFNLFIHFDLRLISVEGWLLWGERWLLFYYRSGLQINRQFFGNSIHQRAIRGIFSRGILNFFRFWRLHCTLNKGIKGVSVVGFE